MSTTPTQPLNAAGRPINYRIVIAVIALALLLLIAGLAAAAVGLSRRAEVQAPGAAESLAPAYVLGTAASGEADEELAKADGPSVELLLAWAPGAETFTAPCAAPVQVVARYAHGPQYVRLDCDLDGLADVWALFEQVGVRQDDMPRLPVENDTHERALGGE